MKRLVILTVIALFVGLLGFRFLEEAELRHGSEIHEHSGGVVLQEPLKSMNEGGEAAQQSPRQGLKTLWEKGNAPERLQVADIDMPLLFEGFIRQELKQVILADIHSIYGSGVTYKMYDWSGRADNPSYNFSGRNYSSSRTLNLRASQVPKIVHEKLGRIIRVDGADHIVVPKELIAAYENAWESKKAAPEKYIALESFIAWINAAPMEELKAKNPYWLLSCERGSDTCRDEAVALKESLLPKRRESLRVGHPSILEFTYVDSEFIEKKGAVGQFPIGVTLADGKYIDENGIPYQQALFMYDGKEWHIAFAPTGT